jgi:DNA-binding transcriptional MerR regulator
MMSHISMKKYSISEAARLLGVHRATLHRWIDEGVVPEPIAEEIAGSRLRYWTEDGIIKLKAYKADHYRKKPRHKKKQRAEKLQ